MIHKLTLFLIALISIFIISCGLGEMEAYDLFINEKFDEAIFKLKKIEPDSASDKRRIDKLISEYGEAKKVFEKDPNNYYYKLGIKDYNKGDLSGALWRFRKIDKKSNIYRKAKGLIIECELKNARDKIKNIYNSHLAGDNLEGKKYMRDLEIIETPNKKLSISISFNCDNGRALIEGKMGEIYCELYTYERPIYSVAISAYYPMVDKYGNEKNVLVLKTILSKKEANKINWSANKDDLIYTLIPRTWKLAWVHHSFR